jgi:hypothetical protein
MPLYIPCSNTFCDGRAEKIGGLCRNCERKAEEVQAKREADRWKFAGFDKSTDNHRKGYRGGKP